MRNDLRLFIGGQEVEFSQDPKILLNYTEKELHNPTIVKNAFTKQIVVEGTPRNNQVFSNIWNLDYYQNANFNPIKKTDFQLYLNGDIFEKGYVKLDKVTRTNNTTNYSFTLYGGLGQFFYNLSYDQDDNSNTKKSLASLKYTEEYMDEPNLDFIINKETVYEAWGNLCGWDVASDEKWKTINFAPAYNGIPDSFDAAKVLINNKNLSANFYKNWNDDGKTYQPIYNGAQNLNGYSMGEMPHDLTEWESRDLRSYLQRPVLRMYKFIQACCQPENNGGYQVILDDHFFHLNNPYYYDSWVTMPLLKDLDAEGGGETEVITGATVGNQTTQHNTRYYPIVMGTSSLASLNNVNMKLKVTFSAQTSTSGATNLYPYRHYSSNTSFSLQPPGTIVKDYYYNAGVIVQLFAFGRTGEVVGQSKAYLLSGQKNMPNKTDAMWDRFYNESDDNGTPPEYVFIEGYWHYNNGQYEFVNAKGEPTVIDFSFQYPTDFTTMSIKVKTPNGDYISYRGGSGSHADWDDTSTVRLYTQKEYHTSGNKTYGEVVNIDSVLGRFGFEVDYLEAIATDYEGLFSGTKITKEKLLAGDKTPADYLLSYCKMFGLYFYYDSTEEAEDKEKYPAGVVHIMDRNSFYKRQEVVDLSELIDWNKKVDITPALAASKWYRFDVEHIDSQVEDEYVQQYGQQYGSQLVNTNYNFDSNTTDLYDGNVFKSGVMVLEKDKYFKRLLTQGLPNYPLNGLKYSLFNRASSSEEYTTYELDYPRSTSIVQYDINAEGYGNYDVFPKLQSHTEDNSPSDGANVLLFLKGTVNTTTQSGTTYYWLTDDVTDMAILNDATPCWILTNSETDAGNNRIAYKLDTFPYFTRDMILFGQTGNIIHSWNFGHPQVTFVPNTYTTDGDSIYDKTWKNYIRDFYSVDSRKLSCYVKAKFDGKPWPYWLRRFYWFENSFWTLNSIKDLNPSSFDTVKMEFIKVQDIENYALDEITYQGINQIIMDDTRVGCQAQTVSGKVIMQSGEGWFGSDWIAGVDEEGNNYYLDPYDVMSPRTGRGQTVTVFTIDLPANTADTNITWTVAIEDDFDKWYRTSFVQETCNTGSTLSITPSGASVGSVSGSRSAQVTAKKVTGLTVSTDVNWITASVNGTALTISYTANNTESGRTGVVTLSGTGVDGAISATYTLTQSGLGEITTDKDLIELDYLDNSSGTVRITTDDSWNALYNDNP